ncbi:MAG TPA: glycoside hydrolase family 38 C-terminal domain-containing protein [Terracidiphilus sp.]|nr:glycoside hydrolase family 38 C-terminal domain-containing protein [Terracidiphilus sp.]
MFRFLMRIASLAAIALAVPLLAQTMKAPDITKDPTLYVVPYAHLDTQWRWEFPQVISEYLLKTMRVNFDYIDKYPHYVFNWTGSNRYRLMKEYFPDDYAKVKDYVAKGRWYPAGSSVEEGDVNLPSAESIFRQVLYGNTYFRKEFGKASAEYMLPDCFGFPASLPTILAHAGVKGFSTQKLSAAWQPAPKVGGPDSPEQTPEGIPFNVGIWKGPDGETVLAALNPGSYGSRIHSDLSKEPPPPPQLPADASPMQRRFVHNNQEQDWVKRINIDGKVTGVFADYHYIGTGDIGGAVNEESVKLLEAMVTKSKAVLPPAIPPMPGGIGGANAAAAGANEAEGTPVTLGDGPVHVISATADQMFLDIKPAMQTKMPSYQGDLELINHSAGSLTSQAYHKRWNRKNELLADAAEKASVAAAWMGGRPYPQERLNNAWTLVMGGQFHDTGAGTATPRAYEFAQNDDLIAANQFSDVLLDATQSVAGGMNTEVHGIPLVVYNPLNVPREDVVEASVDFPGGLPKAVKVVGPDGKAIPAQVKDGKVLFVAKVPSVGYAVYDVQPASGATKPSDLKVSESSLENARYRIQINKDGDVSSILDKKLNKELLAAPMRLALSNDAPRQWPAWNMDFDQEQAEPTGYVSGPAKISVVENGPVRVAVQVSRETRGSKFVQTVRLSTGDAGNRVEFTESIDWKMLSTNLKAVFPLTATNKVATYNWEVGTIQRPTAYDRQFEVASHHWIDMTDQSGSFGTTILTDVKNGSDKRDDHTIRLTLIRTPGAPASNPNQPTRRLGYTDQFNQDWGHHEILFGLAGHAGDWRHDQTDWQAYQLSTPLLAFQSGKHTGALRRQFQLVSVDNPRIRILALKKAEESDETILRLVELDGKPESNVHIKFAGPIESAREVNGQELESHPATVIGGVLETSFAGYQPRTFALKLGVPPAKLEPIRSQSVKLNYDLAAASNDDTKSAGGFDANGDALPAEMLPSHLQLDGVDFQLAPASTGSPDAVVAKGQKIDLPQGGFNKVYVIAASDDGDQKATFQVGTKSVNLTVEDWGGFIGQWDTRDWKPAPDTVPVRSFAFGNNGAPPKQVALRKDWAVSAHHATWDITQSGSPDWSPRYPDDYIGLRPGYVKPATLAWYCSHHHTAAGLNEPYQYSYLFLYSMELPANAKTVTLPDNGNIRILALSVAKKDPAVRPAEPLFDTLGRTEPGALEQVNGTQQSSAK